MPKPTKLHNKGKPKSLQKSVPETETGDNEDIMRQFQLELCWCVQQLERSMNEKKGNEKQMQEAWKVLTVLKNNNQPVIRKRQLMRTHFGDYRAKMAAEEKKLASMANKMKITAPPAKPKATFLRKSVFLTNGDGSFRFNFSTPENTDHNLNKDGNICNENVNNAEVLENSGKKPENEPVTEDNSKQFKFSFSGSDFKFNFNRDP